MNACAMPLVQLLVMSLTVFILQPKSSVGYETDDLIYSGAGSGCFDADDEVCSTFFIKNLQ